MRSIKSWIGFGLMIGGFLITLMGMSVINQKDFPKQLIVAADNGFVWLELPLGHIKSLE